MIKQIIEHKFEEVAKRELADPLSTFYHRLTPSDRNFENALRKNTPAFILECKKASPSQGLIRPDFDVVQIAQTYAPFANAISVLTDETYFQGDLTYLKQVREHTSCPVLCKDFIISTYQVHEARYHGADAILLMLSVIDDDMYRACAQAAAQWNMGILTEVHDEYELQRAIDLNARVIGINNRNFKTLKVDLQVSERLIAQIPSDRISVVESGIRDHRDVMAFRNRANGFLVGTSLMRQPRLDLALRELIFGRVKVCGLTSIEDAQAAYDEGATWGGLIFAPNSPRVIDVNVAEKIVNTVPLQWVGVFVNQPKDWVQNMAHKLSLSAVQLHGDEDYRLDDIPTWKAFRIKDKIPSSDRADKILLDTYQRDKHGGTGKSFDWSLLNKYPHKEHVILSGGISAQNVRQAQSIGTWGIDVNSGVEMSPGHKSEEKLHQLFSQLRENT